MECYNNPVVVWFTGLSGAGKSTISVILESELRKSKVPVYLLDGDRLRLGINRDLSFSAEDRRENIRRASEISKLFLEARIVVLAAFISPLKKDRDLAKEIIGENNFIEVFVSCPIEVCENRDVKGLYRQAREGKIKNFTGLSSSYEPPDNPAIVISTDLCTPLDSARKVIEIVLPRILMKESSHSTNSIAH
jgi:adenylylsulfate kinase